MQKQIDAEQCLCLAGGNPIRVLNPDRLILFIFMLKMSAYVIVIASESEAILSLL